MAPRSLQVGPSSLISRVGPPSVVGRLERHANTPTTPKEVHDPYSPVERSQEINGTMQLEAWDVKQLRKFYP
jgi:hypothetical protein